MSADQFDLVIIGMGSAGMIAAEFAASLNLRVAAVERGRVGGDCLWTGCVPSKALIASAKAAHTMRHADRFGIGAVEPTIDLATVWRRIRAVQATIAASDDDPARYRSMGIDVIHGHARVTAPTEVTVDDVRVLQARFILLCTGSHPTIPALPGLAESKFLTNESLFEIERPPASMIIIGGGPIGVEVAQAFQRLGVSTSVLQRGPRILERDEPALATMLAERLTSEGVDLHLGSCATAVTTDDGGNVTVKAERDGKRFSLKAAGLLVAAGRSPNIHDLGLDEVGIEVNDRGVVVDDRGRTSVRSVYAVGDVVGRYLFTHSAGYEGVRAVRDMFFPGKGTIDDFIPWCTFTDPELAHAGLTTAEAEAKFGDGVDVWRIDLEHNDRARCDDVTNGAIVLVTARERMVGAHILSPHAGELIHEPALAIRHGLKLGDMANLVHVYPTLATAIGMLAAESAYEKAQRYRWLVKRR